MLNGISKVWQRMFFEERPSSALGFFRIACAVTAGTHVIPTLIQIHDNYLAGAFKEVNTSFFPVWFLEFVQRSSDQTVLIFAGAFFLFWLLFLIGLWTQISCILMIVCCYYFYALNSLHLGMLSWDILLVTLFLMALTSYPGDYYSADAWLKRRNRLQPRLRPFFIQRLLQFQLAWIFFYTALVKFYPGNWDQENTYYYLLNTPAEGVVKQFFLREFLRNSPEFCFLISRIVVLGEFFIACALFISPLRRFAVGLGMFFHVLLLLTLHVPTIFFFLFPAQFLLFLYPQEHQRDVDTTFEVCLKKQKDLREKIIE